jgi:hypothetical protein
METRSQDVTPHGIETVSSWYERVNAVRRFVRTPTGMVVTSIRICLEVEKDLVDLKG